MAHSKPGSKKPKTPKEGIRNIKGAGRKPKLTPLEVADVLNQLLNGVRKESVAVQYNVSLRTIERIAKKEQYL